MCGRVPWLTCWLLGTSACGAAGVLPYSGGVPTDYRARFEAPGCAAESHIRKPAAETSFYFVDGRWSYAWLGVDEHQLGSEIENYYKDDAGHHFSVRQRHRGWHYVIPDEVGADGTMQYYDTKFRTSDVGDGFSISGTPSAECALRYVGGKGKAQDADGNASASVESAKESVTKPLSEPDVTEPGASEPGAERALTEPPDAGTPTQAEAIPAEPEEER